ncbi:hypothetical protein JCM11957_04240 [Caminibacter profundus]
MNLLENLKKDFRITSLLKDHNLTFEDVSVIQKLKLLNLMK